MGESALERVVRVTERGLMVKLGGRPPCLDKGEDSDDKSPAGE